MAKDEKLATKRKKRRRGRPRNSDPVDIEWELVDKVYTLGEIRVWPDGRQTLYFPSQRELAERHGVHPATVGQWSKKYEAIARRKEARKKNTPEELWEMARFAGRITVDDGAVCPESLRPLEDGTYRPLLGSPDVHVRVENSRGQGLPSNMLPKTEIERLLVHGEQRETPDGGWSVVYPSIPEIAERYHATTQAISKISIKTRAMERRAQAQEAVRAGLDEHHIKMRIDTETKARARVVSIVDRWLDKFEEALDNGKIKASSIPDLEKLVNLRERLVDLQRQQMKTEGEVSLRDLEKRHLNSVRRAKALPAAASGIVKD